MENKNSETASQETTFGRRRFLAATALAGAGLVLAPRNLNAQNASVPTNRKLGNAINIGVVGTGAQGQVLLTSLSGIANDGQIPFRLRALCDIWPYKLKAAVSRETNNGRQIRKDKQGADVTTEDGAPVYDPSPLAAYYPEDIKGYNELGDMLETQKDLDAVFVATPDHWHARHTIAALNAGKHVYCEKMMARTADEARQMVLTSQKTGKLLQIGHQRRSNPNYRYFQNVLLGKYRFLGDINNANAQWNRAVRMSQDIKVAPNLLGGIKPDILKRSEMASAYEFLNWRWFEEYSNGPISDLGAHQIDIFNWVFGRPRSVVAAGGNDYYSVPRRGYTASGQRPRFWYDNVMCIFDYANIPGRPVGEVARAFYQVLTTTSCGGGYFETFMGERGSMKISEVAANIKVFSEEDSKDYFNYLVKLGALANSTGPAPAAPSDGIADARASKPPEGFDLTSRLGQKYIHQFHIENFFRAIRGEAKLNCDGAHAFESEAPIFRINEAVKRQERIVFTDDDFALVPKGKQPAETAAPAPAPPPAPATPATTEEKKPV